MAREGLEGKPKRTHCSGEENGKRGSNVIRVNTKGGGKGEIENGGEGWKLV